MIAGNCFREELICCQILGPLNLIDQTGKSFPLIGQMKSTYRDWFSRHQQNAKIDLSAVQDFDVQQSQLRTLLKRKSLLRQL